MTNSGATSLYVHIPYCKTICSYCDFCKKNYNFSECLIYILDLVNDINKINKKYKTIYIGGGTPTCIDDFLLEILLKTLSKKLDQNYEFTIEANVENLTENKLKILKKYKINRLSIGVQSFNKDVLKIFNRELVDAVEVVKNAAKYIPNINIDIIYGREFADLKTLINDLETTKNLPIKHFSIYSLQINEHTMLFNQGVKEQSDEDLLEQYNLIREFLKKEGFAQYEVSNFAKPGFESRHNLVYWHNEQYDALGAGASGYNGTNRYKYTNNVLKYINSKTLVENEEVSIRDSFEYAVLLNLRLNDGINIDNINKIYNIDFLSLYGPKIAQLIDGGFLVLENGYLRCTEKATFVQEEVYRKLIF